MVIYLRLAGFRRLNTPPFFFLVGVAARFRGDLAAPADLADRPVATTPGLTRLRPACVAGAFPRLAVDRDGERPLAADGRLAVLFFLNIGILLFLFFLLSDGV